MLGLMSDQADVLEPMLMRYLGSFHCHPDEAGGASSHLPKTKTVKRPLAEYLHDATTALNLRGDELGAEETLKEAVAQYREEAEAHDVYGNFLYNFFRKRRGLQPAEKELREAIRLNPRDGRAHYDLFRVMEADGRDAEAAHERQVAQSLGYCLGY